MQEPICEGVAVIQPSAGATSAVPTRDVCVPRAEEGQATNARGVPSSPLAAPQNICHGGHSHGCTPLIEHEMHYDEGDVFGYGHLGIDNQDLLAPVPEPRPKEGAHSWVRTPLCAPSSAELVDIQAPREAAVRPAKLQLIGQSGLDPSHLLMQKRFVIWCGRCCDYSITAPRALAQRCTSRRTTHGTQALNRVARGQTPASHVSWPLTIIDAPPMGLLRY